MCAATTPPIRPFTWDGHDLASRTAKIAGTPTVTTPVTTPVASPVTMAPPAAPTPQVEAPSSSAPAYSYAGQAKMVRGRYRRNLQIVSYADGTGLNSVAN